MHCICQHSRALLKASLSVRTYTRAYAQLKRRGTLHNSASCAESQWRYSMRTCSWSGHDSEIWVRASRAILGPAEIKCRAGSPRVRQHPQTRKGTSKLPVKHTRHIRTFAQTDIFKLASTAPLLPTEVSSIFSFGLGSAGCTVAAPLIEKFGEPVLQRWSTLAVSHPWL